MDYDRELSSKLIMEYLGEESLPEIDPELLSIELIAFIEGLNFVYALYKDWEMIKTSIRAVSRNSSGFPWKNW